MSILFFKNRLNYPGLLFNVEYIEKGKQIIKQMF
jgi:hypothetical protein